MQYSRERLIRWFHEGRARSREVFAIPRPESYLDRKSTRLNSSHSQISYAVFCLKKKTAVLVAVEPRGQALAAVSATCAAHPAHASELHDRSFGSVVYGSVCRPVSVVLLPTAAAP